MSPTPGPIARLLVSGLIDVIPPFTAVQPYRDRNLNSWRDAGSYSLSKSDRKYFKLLVTQREYGSVLFAEAQHLLNHATEQRASLLNSLSTGREPSPSWTLVTLYYYALFVALGFTRVANSAIVYLDREGIDKYCAGSAAGLRPAGGAFEAIAEVDSQNAASYVTFNKCKSSHFHEAVWKAVHRCLEDMLREIVGWSSTRKATPEELSAIRGLELFRGLSFKEPLAWASNLRNGINYRPGFSYRSVVRNNFLKIASRLAKPSMKSIDAAVEYGERARLALRGATELFEHPNDCVDLLVAQSLFLEAQLVESLAYLCELNGLDNSAASGRRRFATANAYLSSLISMPIK